MNSHTAQREDWLRTGSVAASSKRDAFTMSDRVLGNDLADDLSAEAGEAAIDHVAARGSPAATLVGVRTPRRRRRISGRRRRRRRRNATHAVRAESAAAIDAGRARVAVLAAWIERGEGAVIGGAELLTRQVKRGMARIGRVRTVRRDVDRRAPELSL